MHSEIKAKRENIVSSIKLYRRQIEIQHNAASAVEYLQINCCLGFMLQRIYAAAYQMSFTEEYHRKAVDGGGLD
ncbi:hypothetical protein Nepgr_005163 [Nepenthes gracilis]|uniref:Uncharacterized protein n=1 Tax=Nepenthes gracilis TaxID=150966 RepID=A0AAD3S348_NEPGR|nr:hypothetical protein Nepgr_005163 [Nepenthes gracilis]